jgi:hypothetical protein
LFGVFTSVSGFRQKKPILGSRLRAPAKPVFFAHFRPRDGAPSPPPLPRPPPSPSRSRSPPPGGQDRFQRKILRQIALSVPLWGQSMALVFVPVWGKLNATSHKSLAPRSGCPSL